MNLRIALFSAIAALSVALAAPVAAQTSGANRANSIAAYKLVNNSDREVSVTGEVALNFDNEQIFLRDGSELMIVRLNEKLWDLGLRAGDRVTATGKLDTNHVEQNELIASSITVTGRGDRNRTFIPLSTVATALSMAKPGDIVAMIVETRGERERVITLLDTTGEIKFDRGERAGNDLRPLSTNVAYLAIGRVQSKIGTSGKASLEAIALKPMEDYLRDGTNLRTQSIKAINDSRPIGTQVRARGNLIHYIGKDQLPVLVDGENVLLVRLAPQYQKLEERVGAQVDVVGVYTQEEINGQTYGVLVNARPIPARAAKVRLPNVKLPF